MSRRDIEFIHLQLLTALPHPGFGFRQNRGGVKRVWDKRLNTLQTPQHRKAFCAVAV
ncbi:hypothetical protein [Nostoc sp.]|uniref:hypothetical protein n=1 Tax=Nostoc sp. TaxID=1180 RepID=UPI002FF52C5F